MLPPNSEGADMTRLLDKSPTLNERLKAEEKRLKIELNQAGAGSVRDKILEKLRHLDAAAHINEWLSSPGLRAPT
jgi:hypothetical protein